MSQLKTHEANPDAKALGEVYEKLREILWRSKGACANEDHWQIHLLTTSALRIVEERTTERSGVSI